METERLAKTRVNSFKSGSQRLDEILNGDEHWAHTIYESETYIHIYTHISIYTEQQGEVKPGP